MADRLEVGLLGSVEVRASGAVVPIAGAKLKAIVALLALSSPHPASAERLIDGVWDDDLPGNPTNSLQAQVSSLRRLLGRDAIARRGQGYMLAVGPDDVDAIRFERLVRAGREAGASKRRLPEALWSTDRARACRLTPRDGTTSTVRMSPRRTVAEPRCACSTQPSGARRQCRTSRSMLDTSRMSRMDGIC